MKVTSSFDRPVLLAFVTTILALVLVSALSYRSYHRSRLSGHWIRHTHEVLHHLDDLLAVTESAESRCRGFILTGQPFYLDAYRASVIRAQQEETTLRMLTSDNMEQQRRLSLLETLMAQAVRNQEMLIHLRQKHGLQTAARFLEGESGRGLMVRSEAQGRELEDEELRLLAQRRENAKRGLQADWIVLTLGTGLGILIAAAASLGAWRGDLAQGRSEQVRRECEERYRMLLDGVRGYAIFMLDLQGRVISWNAGAEQLKGYKASEIIGKHFSCFFPPEEIKQGRPEEVLKLAASNGRYEARGMRVRKDASQFPANITLTPLHDLSGELRGYSEVSHDLTEAEESRARYRGLLEAAPDALVIVAETGEIVLLNNLAETQFGYERNELLGQKVTNIIPRGFAEQLIADLTTAVDAPEQQIGMGLELSGRRKDGSEFPIEIMLSPLDSPRGILVTAAIRDISLRKEAEQTLAQTEARYRGLLEAAPDAMVVVNQSGDIVLLNVQAEKRFGYKRDELLGRKVTDIIPEGFAERIVTDALRSTEDALSQQIDTGIELAGRRKDGSEFPIEIMLSPLDSPDGILVTAAVRDISERRIAEEALRESEARFRTMANNISQLAWMADETGSIFWHNNRWFDYSGATLEEMSGHAWQELQHPDHVERVTEEIKRCFQAGKVWENTFPLRGRDGSYRWFLSQAIPVRDSQGNVSRWFGTNTDISEIRRMEEELFAEKERAQEAREEKIRLQVNAMERAREEKSHLQEAFLSRVSHELRTPLTAIYFFTTNLLDGLLGDLTIEQHEHLARLLTNVSQLKDMVDDLLDITRIDTHKFTLEPRHTNPLKLIADALSTCYNNSERKHISLHSEVAGSLPFVWADASRVRQILINLIDNGIKFTPNGGSVTVGSLPLEKRDDFLCLSVSDTGSGISPENLEIVFDRLAQLENANQASRNGLGLGLFIARELVSLHGGRIWVESTPGKGCTFYFTLPLFSLAKLCADIFTDSNLSAGHVTLMAVDVCAIEGTVRAEIELEIRRVLSRSIHPAQDILLPAMNDAVPVTTYFIVACTDANGSAVIASRIARELRNFDGASKLKPVISLTTLLVARGSAPAEQRAEVAKRIERLVQSHLETGCPLDQWCGLSIPTSVGSF